MPFALLAAPVAGASATLLMSAPLSGSTTNATPTFSGSTEDNEDAVTVVVHESASSAGPIAQTLTPVPASGGLWSATAASLPEGTYTAVAEQTESADMGETGFSNAVIFEVVTKPPTVTLEAPKSPSKDTTPSFKGSSSEAGEVTVDIYAGSTASGSPVSTAVAHASGAGEWASGAASPALAGGEYTAAAVQESNLGNGPGTSDAVSFVVDTKSPTVTLDPVATPSRQTRPSFAGTASEAGEVTVHVHKGSASGSEVASVTVVVAGGEWSSPALSSALADGEYTAVATEPSSLGNGEGKSSAVIFDVDTEAPTVTLAGPPTRSQDTTPSFEGTASETGEVTVHVHKGSASGSEVAHVTFAVSEGAWSSPAISPGLGEGEYTAVATEPSALGNGEGTSEAVTFEVVTAPPSVSLEAPASPSKNTKPSFKGTTSEGGEVKVEIHVGSTVSGAVVATAAAHPSVAGGWTSGAASPALASGEYTAVAVQESSLGNGPGTSNTEVFVVDTESPKVSLEGPPALSKETRPSFKGTASEAGTVTVHVFKGSKASGTEAASVEAVVSGGKWASGQIGPALAEGEYTAVADEPSSLGNPDGVSNTVGFFVDTKAPTLTLEAPASPSKDTTPVFVGSTSEAGEVKVEIHAGSATGTVVATAVAHAAGAGEWSSGAAGPALTSGEYTAVAVQESGLGNGLGKSSPVTFIVNTAPPSVILEAPASPSKNTQPSFKGTTSEGGEVKVSIYVGSSASGTPVSTAVAHPSAPGAWSSGAASPALASGEYTAVAVQESSLGNGPGTSKPVTFEVNTEAPRVSLEGPPAISKDNTPSFKGTASEAGTVTVHVHKGATVSGSEVAKATATVSGGKWSATVGAALADGQYTAVATEPSSLGNAEGASGAVTFEVDTSVPKVTLEQPASPSSDTTPSFTGTSTEAGEVKVEIHAGSSVAGTLVATATGHVSAGKWTSSAASPALVSGEYTAVAVQESSLGNGPGASSPVTFVVDTSPPSLTLEKPASPSKNTKPSFKGTSSEGGEVKVEIHTGSTVAGALVAAAAAHPSVAGGWTSGAASPALVSGEYTAVAVQQSSLGNGPGSSKPVTFIVNTESPTVTLSRPPSPSKNTKPSFKGTASEAGTVTVHVYKGGKVEGKEVAGVEVQAAVGEWSSGGVSPALADGEYTAVATEPSSLGNAEGSSNAVTFEVSTKPPALTLEQQSSPSNKTMPVFTGSSSEAGEVVVQIFAGASASGSVVSTAVAHPSAPGAWSSGAASPALVSGEYTAVAVQESSLGNGPGASKPVTFIVNTESPKVSLEKPASPSKNTKPSFKGTTSEGGEVKVSIYVGSSASGTPVSTAVAHPSAPGAWSSGAASTALASGEYTAVAVQESSLGNGPGASKPVTFIVNTESPKVTLEEPESPSKDTTPSFTGTASEAGTVTVHVYKGGKVEGKELASAEAQVAAGKWSSGGVSPALADGEYTAVATEPSALGNAEGTSNPVTFEVNTKPPTVTLEQPESPSSKLTPTFSGTASADTEVVIHIYLGSKAQGTPVASATAKGTGHEWTSGAASPALSSGVNTYTAVAEQSSPLGNGPGKSSPVTFLVDTNPPTVSLKSLPTPSKVTKPSFEGSASETTPVTVHVYNGPQAEGPEVASVTVAGTGGPWKSGQVSPALADGEYTAVATEESAIGNGQGTSNPVTFEVNTKPPTVTLNQPTSPSRNTKPSFTGTASATTTVVVHIFEGTEASGTEVATATATGTGSSWTSGAASPALASEDRTYTAMATQESPLGNPEGKSNPITFIVNTEGPKITLEKPKSPSNDTTPTFVGTSNANGKVVVHVYEGTKAEPGKEVTEVAGTASEGKWSAGPATLSGGEHTYTAVATQASPISGNPEGASAPVSFIVSTESPKVTLEQPPTPSNETVRSFKGTASATTGVVVHVYEGVGTGGTEVAKATATVGGGGEWVSGSVTLPAGERTFTAMAEQPSPLGNPPGKSKALSFFVNTEAPKVAIGQPESPSNNTTPTLSGTTNAETSVVVHVFEGAKEVAKATATPSAGAWSTKVELPPTGERTYTAFATQVSPFKGNSAGQSTSVTFLVDTEGPKLTLGALPRSNDSTPTFGGTTNASTEVVVHVFAGTEAKGTEVAQATAKGSEGKWISGQARLAAGEHTYTAIATQASPFKGNPEGKSTPITFTVDTLPPTVTLSQPSTPSKNTKPSFSGTASENTTVTLKVFLGSKAEGTPVATKTATVESGSWKVGEVALAGGRHTYTAVASQPSEIGNTPGESAHAVFEVDTEPPAVTLNPIAVISNNPTPSFAGTASDTTTVTVAVYEGSVPEGTPVRTLKAQPSEDKWETATLTPKLGNGRYAAVAMQTSSIGNPEGESNVITFEINTSSPSVTLNHPASPSNHTTLSFSGSASEATEVTVDVYEGLVAEGKILKEAKASGTHSTWTSSSVTLSGGTYTAVAIQTSALKNVPGESAPVTFVIDTEPPAVKLSGPKAPSNDRTPAFSGTSNEGTPVTVDIYEGTTATGALVSTATATPSLADGSWTFEADSGQLPEGLHTFTAVANQPSGIGNAPGKSAPVTFIVDTLSPIVTLRPVAAEGDAKPSFSGTASETGTVTVNIYAGAQSQPNSTPVVSLTAEAEDGEWISGQLANALANGVYTAVATQASTIGNNPGESAPMTFTVNTSPPTVSIEPPSAVKNTSALLNASIDPNNGHVGSCSVEFGTTTSYGTLVGCAFSIAGDSECTFSGCVFPSGTSAVAVYARIFELKPSTTYFYRVAAENERGSGSAEGSFTTAARPPANLPQPPAPAGPSAAATGVAASRSATVAKLLEGDLDPTGRAARIAALLKAGAYKERLSAGEAGTASVKWYFLPPGAKIGGKGKHAPVLVASGSVKLGSTGVGTVKIRLTPAGKRLLSHAKTLRLTATCVFTPIGTAPITVSRRFELKR